MHKKKHDKHDKDHDYHGKMKDCKKKEILFLGVTMKRHHFHA